MFCSTGKVHNYLIHEGLPTRNGDQLVINVRQHFLFLADSDHSEMVIYVFEEAHSMVTNSKWSPSVKDRESWRTFSDMLSSWQALIREWSITLTFIKSVVRLIPERKCGASSCLLDAPLGCRAPFILFPQAVTNIIANFNSEPCSHWNLVGRVANWKMDMTSVLWKLLTE